MGAIQAACAEKGDTKLNECQDRNAVFQVGDAALQAKKAATATEELKKTATPMWLSEVWKANAAAEAAAAAKPAPASAEPAEGSAQADAAPKDAAAAGAGQEAAAGVWAAGEEEAATAAAVTTAEPESAPIVEEKAEVAVKKKDDEEKKKKTADATKKKKVQDVKKRKEEDAAKKQADEAAKKKAQEEAAAAEAAKKTEEAKAGNKEAIRAREQAWKKKPAKEKEELAKKMHAAAKAANVAEVETLMEQGVSANAEDGDGWTPLIVAAEKGEKGLVETLLNNGANPKAAVKLGEWGQTALHFAARHGHREVADLVVAGSNVKAKNFQGKTPSEVAKTEGHKEIAKWLRGLEKQAA